TDDGCGMDFTDNPRQPGRLDRFLGLGLSAIAGLPSDEFAWKGLGAKLSFQSHRVEVETWTGVGKALSAIVNEPWSSIERDLKPRPRITKWEPKEGQAKGTTVRVFGHPPGRREKPLTFEEIKDYLCHRTFVGFTRERENAPEIELAVHGRRETISVGFPELRSLPEIAPEGTVIIEPLHVSKKLPSSNRGVHVVLKGFYTWDDRDYGLRDVHLNTGLILSVGGIPYFTLHMRELGSGELAVARPGVGKCCLIVECDEIQEEMNISRSGLVDSALTDLFKKAVGELISKVEGSRKHSVFRLVPKRRKERKGAKELYERKRRLESRDQKWVYWRKPTGEYVRLMREPENESDTLAVLWKLEAIGALPFNKFETLAYSGKGADLIVHFQEDETSDSELYTTMEVEKRLSSYKAHGHLPAQFPTVICWEIASKPKLSVKATSKRYKSTASVGETMLRIYVLREMPGIRVLTEEEQRHEAELRRAQGLD
ncbi:MAG: hypothetical protein ACE5IF_04290, partial [Candidatus Bathyarchaeia archaeon]